MEKNTTPLLEALRKRGISMMDAAQDVGIPYVTFWRHCHGKNTMSLWSAQCYAKKLGIPIEEIIGFGPRQTAGSCTERS